MSVLRTLVPTGFEIEYWHWLALGLGLIAVEILVPGFWLLWVGIGALGVGMVLFAFPDLSWQGQLALFAGLSLAAVLAGRHWWRRRLDQSDDPALNNRAGRMRGRVLVLDQPIANGHGRTRVGDAGWNVAGPDLPAGTRVVVTGINGATLMVVASPTAGPTAAGPATDAPATDAPATDAPATDAPPIRGSG